LTYIVIILSYFNIKFISYTLDYFHIFIGWVPALLLPTLYRTCAHAHIKFPFICVYFYGFLVLT
jgi:hypothetical protein